MSSKLGQNKNADNLSHQRFNFIIKYSNTNITHAMKIRVSPSNNGIRIGENTQNQLIVLNPNTFAVAKINVSNIKNTLEIPLSIVYLLHKEIALNNRQVLSVRFFPLCERLTFKLFEFFLAYIRHVIIGDMCDCCCSTEYV